MILATYDTQLWLAVGALIVQAVVEAVVAYVVFRKLSDRERKT